MTRFLLASLALALIGCHAAPTESQSDASAPWDRSHRDAPQQLNDGWRVAPPDDVGFDVATLESMTAAISEGTFQKVHAVLIARDDRLVFEAYFTGEDRRFGADGELHTVEVRFDRDTLHDVRSMGKSFTSALVGAALDSGAISSLDAPLAEYFPEHEALVSPAVRELTLRHSLTMSAGLDWNERDISYTDPENHYEHMTRRADPVAFLLGRPMVGAPGATWYYNSGLPTLLGMVVSRATGKPFGAYAREVLFEPLGISEVEWAGPQAWSGIPEFRWDGTEAWSTTANPAGTLWLRPRDIAKFGLLYLNEGRWNGRQILPAAWIQQSTLRRIAVTEAESEYGTHGYGYLWWHDVTTAGEIEIHTAVGNGGQRLYVIPSLDVLVLILAGAYNEPDADWMPEELLVEHILPAVRNAR